MPEEPAGDVEVVMTDERQNQWDRGLRTATLATIVPILLSTQTGMFRQRPMVFVWTWAAIVLALVVARIIVRSGLLGGRIMDRE